MCIIIILYTRARREGTCNNNVSGRTVINMNYYPRTPVVGGCCRHLYKIISVYITVVAAALYTLQCGVVNSNSIIGIGSFKSNTVIEYSRLCPKILFLSLYIDIYNNDMCAYCMYNIIYIIYLYYRII